MATVPGGPLHLAFEMLKRAANVDMTLVPFAGGAPRSRTFGQPCNRDFSPYAGLEEQLKSGRLRALARPHRTERTSAGGAAVAESGYKGYEAEFWNGLVAPAKTRRRQSPSSPSWFTAAMRVPEIKAKLVAQSLYPVGICGADFGAIYASNMTSSAASFVRPISRPSRGTEKSLRPANSAGSRCRPQVRHRPVIGS